MITQKSTLEDIFDHVWELLIHTKEDKGHSFRYPALATHGNEGIQQRTVVLRNVNREQRQLMSYSDLRTQKVADLSFHPEASWLFYHQPSQEQVRVRTTVHLLNQTPEANSIWEEIPPKGRADYIGPLPPGASSQQYLSNLPDSFKKQPTEENTDFGVENFCVIKATVESIDFLKLDKEGHIRASYIWKDTHWDQQWVAP